MNELREKIIPVRVSYLEYENIVAKAQKAKRKVSSYMREVALGTVIKEKPDERFYEWLKDLRNIRMNLKNIIDWSKYTENIEVQKFEKEIEKIDKFILEIKQAYL